VISPYFRLYYIDAGEGEISDISMGTTQMTYVGIAAQAGFENIFYILKILKKNYWHVSR
jgi:hypothetical protein